MIALDVVRWRLALLWFIGGGLIFLLLLVQSITGVYADRIEDVWGWFSAAVLPTLSLIITVFSANAVIRPRDPVHSPSAGAPHSSPVFLARREFVHLALGLSLLYLAVALLSILAVPYIESFYAAPREPEDILGAEAAAKEIGPADALLISQRWLGVLQSLVVASLSALFFTPRAQD